MWTGAGGWTARKGVWENPGEREAASLWAGVQGAQGTRSADPCFSRTGCKPFLREQPSGSGRSWHGSQHHLHRRFCATAARSCTMSTRQAFCCSSLSPLPTLPCLPAPGACHKKTYDNRDTVCRMLKAQNFQIMAQGLELPDGISPLMSVPSELVRTAPCAVRPCP